MFGCPLVQRTQPWNPWEGPAGALLRVGDSGRALWLPVVSAYLQRVMLQWVRSHGRWLPCPLVQSVPAGGLLGSLPGVHESMYLVRCTGGQPVAATLLVASKISLRLLWWPPTEHQCVLIYRCVFTHVCCWLFSVGNKVTTTTNGIDFMIRANRYYIYDRKYICSNRIQNKIFYTW